MCYFVLMTPDFRLYPFLFLLLVLLTACGGGDTPAPQPRPQDAGEVLSTGIYSRGGASWRYQNLRLPNRNGGYAYARYFQANGAGPHSVVVVIAPYAGIDWSGEAVDKRWADQYKAHLDNGGGASLCVPDVDGPDYDSLTSASICYSLSSPGQTGDEASVYLLNNVSVLVAYGRFYAGGSVVNDIEDVVAGLRFLGTRSEIDLDRIGMIGGSWGGFEALYAALRAPANVRPAVVVPAFPVTDFAALTEFVTTELPGLVSAPVLQQYQQFYDPFLRRFYASAGTPPDTDYRGYTLADLSARVDMPMLIPHDDGDTILPARFSHEFAQANAPLIEGFWYKRRDAAPWESVITRHGEIEDFILLPSHYTFSAAYLLSRLNGKGRSLYIPYGEQDMQIFFTDIRNYQLEGRDVSWLTPRLIEMCKMEIYMYELTAGNSAPISSGADYLARSLNTVWGTALTASTVRQYLLDNGLPAP